MRECAVLTILEAPEIPDDCSEEYNRRLHKKVALLLHPTSIEVEHDSVRRFVCVRYIGHERRMDWIASMAPLRIIEVDYIEFRGIFTIPLLVIEHVVVRYCAQIGILIIINIKAESLLYLLFNEIIDHCV